MPSTHGVEWAEVTGRDQAENERHGIARVAFLNALFSDPRVRALWERWMTRSGAREAAQGIRVLLNSPIATHRRSRRGAAIDVPPALGLAMDRLERAWPADDLSYMEEALTFVRETLKLPWPWVAGELAAEWQVYIWTAAFGRQHWHRRLTLSPPIAPAVSFSFTPRADETAPAAIDRLMRELRCYLQEISEPAPQGRRVTRNGAHIAQWATWFYRCRAKVPPDRLSTLAREIRAQRAISDSGARRQVQLGVEEAERLLGLDVLVDADPRK